MSDHIIIQNEVKCLKCDEIIFSKNRHDFVSCGCGNIAVDGGTSYIRRVGNGIQDRSFEERSMSMDKNALKACTNAVIWGQKSGRNETGIALAVIRALRDNELLNMRRFEGK